MSPTTAITTYTMKSKSKFALRCIAPDAEYVTEGINFPTVESAWKRADDMGSRWIFYPIHVVTTNGSMSRKTIIRGVPIGMPSEWEGKTFGRLLDAMKELPHIVTDYVNGSYPHFAVYP